MISLLKFDFLLRANNFKFIQMFSKFSLVKNRILKII